MGLFSIPMEASTNYYDPEACSKAAELVELYRSISLLPVLSKLFEKLLLARISIIMNMD